MWLWPLILLSLAPDAIAAPSGVPPSPQPLRTHDSEVLDEPGMLWEDGKNLFDSNSFELAIEPLRRLIEKYPASPKAVEAHWLLGRAYLENSQPALAAASLKYYIEARKKTPEASQARLELGRAYTDLKKFNEAYLLSVEILSAKPRLPEILTSALLLKAQALIGLNHDLRATEALDAAQQVLPQNNLRLHGETASIGLRLKTRECARFPSTGSLDEGQIRDQLDRRGTCLLGATLLFRNAIQAGDPRSTEAALGEIEKGFKEYFNSCDHPPDPSQKRTQIELKRYRAELTEALQKDCRRNRQKALDQLDSWKTQLRGSSNAALLKLRSSLLEMRPAP